MHENKTNSFQKKVQGRDALSSNQDSNVSYTLEWTEKQEDNTFSPFPTKNLNS